MPRTPAPSSVGAIQQSVRSLRRKLSIFEEILAALQSPAATEAFDLIYELDSDGGAELASPAARRLHGGRTLLLTDLVHQVHLTD